MSVPMERTKACTKCGIVKPFSAFSKHRLSKDGHAYQCKECNAKRAKMWRSTPAGIYSIIKGRENFMKKKPFSISKEEFAGWYEVQPKICIYCDISQEDAFLMKQCYNAQATRLSVDCKDNDVGYILENMVLACGPCNLIKGNMFTFDEMREIGQKYVKPKWKLIKIKQRMRWMNNAL